ncbi:MAG TPA: cation-transporting P-type ATPase, partial [Methylophilaceae bacterium]|nr:cation-transporting P-type ATPase [Methylophilaceae bacterium]
LQLHGPNSLPQAHRRPAWLRFLLQFHNPLIYVLVVSGVVTFALADYVDSGVIFGVVVINAIIGFVQEGKAESALEAVRQMLAIYANVLRDGERCQVDASTLVPGDVVLLESGDKVPADLRLIKARNLGIEESALTGESVPVEKAIAPVAADAVIADRSCMAYSGTLVTAGHGQGIVVATGGQTEIGRIGSMVGELQTLSTPLTRRLDQLARQITAFILAIGLLTFLYGFFVAKLPALDIFLAVVGLAVAAIPEGLPAIVTIVLAIGTRAMARNRAIIRRLPAVETLGSVSVICTDKTGTLTRNEMTVVRLFMENREIAVSGGGYVPEGGFHEHDLPVDVAEDMEINRLARCALLCNDASIRHEADAWHVTGDPTEGALITLARKAGLDPVESSRLFPRVDEIPFDSERRFMATLHHDHEGHHFILLKGAPERVLELCTRQAGGRTLDHDYWLGCIHGAAAAGERVLALAQCELHGERMQIELHDIMPRFELLGLVGIIDPPREEAVSAIAECRRAGIEVKMITGDHAVTAAAIGSKLGLSASNVLTGEMIAGMDDAMLRQKLSETDVIARANPEHKLRLIAILQSEGQLVAMTGDGVNDAPALKAADIGVAMGGKGTDAAREASDIVLTDDNFATIERAVREGRIVFDNLKKSLLFLLPTDIGEGGVILLAIFAGLAMPVTAGQILWVNTVTAITLALALAFEPGERNVMDHPPRPSSEPIVTRMLALRILFVAMLMMAATFSIFEWELSRGSSIETARTAAVNMLVAGELIYLFNVRHFTTSAFTWETLTGNPVVLWVSAALIVFQLLFTYAAPMQELFLTQALDAASWLIIVTFAIVEFLAVEIEKAVWRGFKVVRM